MDDVKFIIERKGFIVYIDPNTGGMLFQVLAGTLAVASGILLMFSGQIRRMLARLRRKLRKNEDEDQG